MGNNERIKEFMDQTEYYRQYRARKEGKPDYTIDDMIKCLLCGKLFVFVGNHVRIKHKITMLEYKIQFGLDTKKGRTTGKFRELKNKTNKGVKNLEAGAKYRFIKGDPTAGKYKRSPETLARLTKGIRNTTENNY